MASRLVGAKPWSEPMLEILSIQLLGTNFSEILIPFMYIYTNRRHEQAVMKLWHVTNIIVMSIHKELLIAICTMHYVAISIRVCEISLWRPLRHATGGSKGCRPGLSDRQPSVPPLLPGLSRRRPMCHRVEVETDILNYLCMLKWAIIAQVVSSNWLVYTDLPFWA